MSWKRVLISSLLCCSAATAQNMCRTYLADHLTNNTGVGVDLETTSSGTAACTLTGVILVLGVGSGTKTSYATAMPQWQLGHTYTVKAVVTAAGSQQLYLDGQLLASMNGAFQPIPGPLYGSEVPGWANGPTAYLVEQSSLQIANGTQSVSLPATGTWAEPAAPLLLLGGAPMWGTTFSEDASQPLTITATFQIQAALTNPAQYNPYVDPYGQLSYGIWPSKVKSDADLQTAVATEQTWLAANPPLPGLDAYGGSLVAGWHDVATGYTTRFSTTAGGG